MGVRRADITRPADVCERSARDGVGILTQVVLPAVSPPSIAMAAPFTKRDSSEAKKAPNVQAMRVI